MDYHVPRGPFEITCDDFDVTITSNPEEESVRNAIPMMWAIAFAIPSEGGRGKIVLHADAWVLKNRVDIDAKIYAEHIDLMQFLPYFNSYTPFSFREGVFSSTTELKVTDNTVDSLTTMIFHRLKFLIDRGMENAQFLETSVNKLAPYLMSGKGEIVFDFVIKGPLGDLRTGVGPRVKFAIGLAVMDEVGKALQRFSR